ncbi:unnamed protein product [Pedinophyceae sp. YPF-701]|nr:unnamed protein product [Pedinophyceae sp. YPF-701]
MAPEVPPPPGKIYKRPTHGRPTRYLFVGNCGYGVGMNEEECRDLVAPWNGSVRYVPGKAFILAAFPDADAAAAARAALSVRHPACSPQRPMLPSYTDCKEPAVVPVTYQEAQPGANAARLGVPGLALVEDFVSAEEEEQLLREADAAPWDNLKKRRVQHHGYRFNYETRVIDVDVGPSGPLPPLAGALARRIEASAREHDAIRAVVNATDTSAPEPAFPRAIDQLTLNEYTPGVGLSPHVDSHSCFEGAVAIVSLASDTVMSFRRAPTAPGDGDGGSEGARAKADTKALLLPRRSLLVMHGEARYAWEHYIPHRKEDRVVGRPDAIPRGSRRVSLTYRCARKTPCRCRYPWACDSQGNYSPTRLMMRKLQAAGNTPSTTSEPAAAPAGPDSAASTGADDRALIASPEALETAHVHEVYDAIAAHFSATRFSVWPRVREFLESPDLPANALIADVGCGNGKYFGVRRDAFVVGTDVSRGLAVQAAARLRGGRAASWAAGETVTLADVAVADGLRGPLRSGAFDAVVSVAVIHHISTEERRVAFVREAVRLLRPGGRGLLTAWATEQGDPRKLQKWRRLERAAAAGGLGADYFVPWHVPFHRVPAVGVGGEGAGGGAAAEAARSAARGGSREGAGGVGTPGVDAEKRAVVYNRFYHLFERGELTALVERAGGAVPLSEVYDRDNWVVVFQRS